MAAFAISIAPRALAEALPARIASTAAASHGLVAIQPPIAIPGFDVAMFWHPRRERDPAARWLRDRLREAAAALRDPG